MGGNIITPAPGWQALSGETLAGGIFTENTMDLSAEEMKAAWLAGEDIDDEVGIAALFLPMPPTEGAPDRCADAVNDRP